MHPGPCTHLYDVDIQVGTTSDRQLIYIDRNRDLYILPVMKRGPVKLAAMVDSAMWHDATGMLAAMVEQRLVGGIHRFPSCVQTLTKFLRKSRQTDFKNGRIPSGFAEFN